MYDEISIDGPRPKSNMVVSRISAHESDNINFSVSVARGGLIVSVSTYDTKSDRHHYVNHIIHDDEDTAKNIADIVSVELMKR